MAPQPKKDPGVPGTGIAATVRQCGEQRCPTFSVDGSNDTEAYDINNGGDVVGYYYGADAQYHGFIRSNDGQITDQYDPPKSKNTYAYGIDDRGNIAGNFSDGKQLRGFFNHIPFDPPGSVETDAYIVYDGVVPGYFRDKTGYHGFIRSADGTIATYDVAGAVDTRISDYANGYATGYFYDGTENQCFLLNTADGTFTIFSIADSTGTECFSINPNRDISGFYIDGGGAYHGLVRAKDGTITTFDVPGAADTIPNSNHGKKGTIVGNWRDDANKHHAFIRSPGGKITTYDVKGAAWTNGIDVNLGGKITGFYFDNKGDAISYIRLP